MPWQLLIGISIFVEAIGRITQRVLMKGKDSDPIPVAVIYQLTAGILLFVFALSMGFSLPDLRPLWLILLLAPIFWGLANIFIFKSLQSTEASVFTVLFTTRTVWIILLSILLLGDAFSGRQLIGALFILSAVILVSWKRQAFSVKKGEIFALVAALFIALGVINDAFVVRALPVAPYLAYNFFFSGIFVWLINPQATKRILAFTKVSKEFGSAALLAFLYASSAMTYLLAYQVGKNAAQLGAIYPISNILVVLLAIVFLREKSNLLTKLFAVILSVIGIVLVS